MYVLHEGQVHTLLTVFLKVSLHGAPLQAYLCPALLDSSLLSQLCLKLI